MKYKFDQSLHGQTGTDKYLCTIRWRNGTIHSDEPVAAGGGDKGPEPHELLLSSLASCTLITLRMYIDRKGWDIPELAVRVNMYSRTGEQPGSVIDVDLDFPGDVDDAKKLRLREIAQHCPVSKILESGATIRTFLLRSPDGMKTITYPGEGIRVFWKPELCQHSQRCFRQLPMVFRAGEKKWVHPDEATPERVLEQVRRCPSGALTGEIITKDQ